MGCASTSVAAASQVVESADPSAGSTPPFTAKVHPLQRMDALMENDLTPMTPSSDGGTTEILDSGYHDSKRMSQMSNDSIESMMLHIVEDKSREAIITEVVSMAQETADEEKEEAAEKDEKTGEVEKVEEEVQKTEEESCLPGKAENNEVETVAKTGEENNPQSLTSDGEEGAQVEMVTAEEEKSMSAAEASSGEEIWRGEAEESGEAVPGIKDEEQQIETAVAGEQDKGESDAEEIKPGNEEERKDENRDEENALPEVAEVENEPENFIESGDESATVTAEPAAEGKPEEDGGSSELHFEMRAEDVEMLEAQLRELSVPTPAPAEQSKDSIPEPSANEVETAEVADGVETVERVEGGEVVAQESAENEIEKAE